MPPDCPPGSGNWAVRDECPSKRSAWFRSNCNTCISAFWGLQKRKGQKSWKICEWYGDVGIRIKCNDLSQNNHCEPKFDRRDLYIHVTSQVVAMLKYVEYREISVVMLVCLFRGCPICCTSKWSMKVYHITCIVHRKSSQHISNSKLFPLNLFWWRSNVNLSSSPKPRTKSCLASSSWTHQNNLGHSQSHKKTGQRERNFPFSRLATIQHSQVVSQTYKHPSHLPNFYLLKLFALTLGYLIICEARSKTDQTKNMIWNRNGDARGMTSDMKYKNTNA